MSIYREARHCEACKRVTPHARYGCASCRTRERREKRGPVVRAKAPSNLTPAKYGTHRQKVAFANNLWRKLIYRKAPHGLCLNCMKRPLHDAMHIFAKGPYPHMRFDLENGIPGCRACHRLIDSNHEAKISLAIRILGAHRYEMLRLRSIARDRGKLDMALVILSLEATTRSSIGG